MLRPSVSIEISRLEKDPDKLRAIYELGYEDAKKHFSDLMTFAGR